MWRRSSISSVSSASRARRYSALSLGKRTLLARASSAAGFKAELAADLRMELLMTDLASANFDGLRLEDVRERAEPTGASNFSWPSHGLDLRIFKGSNLRSAGLPDKPGNDDPGRRAPTPVPAARSDRAPRPSALRAG